MSLKEHATIELEKAGLFDKDSDYDGMIGASVIDLIKVFSEQRHSGMSASMVRELFYKLSNFDNLTPITNDPEEWMDRTEMSGKPFWQCRRNSAMFSEDGGKTYWHVDDSEIIITAKEYNGQEG